MRKWNNYYAFNFHASVRLMPTPYLRQCDRDIIWCKPPAWNIPSWLLNPTRTNIVHGWISGRKGTRHIRDIKATMHIVTPLGNSCITKHQYQLSKCSLIRITNQQFSQNGLNFTWFNLQLLGRSMNKVKLVILIKYSKYCNAARFYSPVYPATRKIYGWNQAKTSSAEYSILMEISGRLLQQ